MLTVLVYAMHKISNRNASNFIVVDLNRYAKGVYVVKLIYNNKVITERIIKRL